MSIALKRPTLLCGFLLGLGGVPHAFGQLESPHEIGLPDSAGVTLIPIGDVDGDGVEDFAYGAPQLYREATAQWHNGEVLPYQYQIHDAPVGEDGRGYIVIASGATGATLRVIPGPADALGFGAALALVDDRNGDGFRDLAVGAPGMAHEAEAYRMGDIPGRVFIVSAGTGEILGEHRLAEPRRGFGARLASCAASSSGNRLLAGIPDRWARPHGPSTGAYLFEGSSELPILTVPRPQLPLGLDVGWGGFAQDIALICDVNADEVPDILVLRAETRHLPSALLLYCGASGEFVREHTSPGSSNGERAFIALARPASTFAAPTGYAALEQDAADQTLRIRTFAASGQEEGNSAVLSGTTIYGGPTLAYLGDIDGDGFPDYAIGHCEQTGAHFVCSAGPFSLAQPPGSPIRVGVSMALLGRDGSSPILAVGALGGRSFEEGGAMGHAPAFFLYSASTGELIGTAPLVDPPHSNPLEW